MQAPNPLALGGDPLALLCRLAAAPGTFLFEVEGDRAGLVLLGCAPRRELRIDRDGKAWLSQHGRRHALGEHPLEALERFVAELPRFPKAGRRFPAGAIGYIAYELGRWIERLPGRAPDDLGLPLAVLRWYDPLLVYDRATGQLALCTTDGRRAARWLEYLSCAPPQSAPRGPLAAGPIEASLDCEPYVAAVERIHEYIRAGDVYQVNLSRRLSAPIGAPAQLLFDRLARAHPVPFGAYIDCGEFQIVSNSPELFLRRRGQHVETRPIKGTRPRGRDDVEDARLLADLRADPKEAAEHVMIVDLERNDLGRVCVPGTVHVTRYAASQTLGTLHHMVSVVEGELQPGTGLAALLRATFPGGSITGAPKIRAMEIIDEVEPTARGVYTGAIGVIDPEGDLELALAIRTAVVCAGRVTYHCGGAIVADSRPERELRECELKAAAFLRALGASGPG